MRKLSYIFIVFAMLTLIGTQTLAAATEVTATLSSNTIPLDGQVTLNINISGSQDIAEPELPPLPAFRIYTSGRTSMMNYENGRMTNSVAYKYILIPTSVGKFLIGPAKVTIKGKEYTTEPLALEVTKTATGLSAPPNQGRQDAGATDDGDYFITAEISKDTVYEGEQILYVFKAYQNRRASIFSDPVYVPPSFSGFWKEDTGWQRYNKNYQGSTFLVSEQRSYLFPVSPGSVTIDPARVTISMDEISRMFSFDPFNSRSNTQRNRHAGVDTLKTKAVNIEVLPLPREGRPRSFKGAVGDYDMTVDLSNTKVTVDETMLLTVKISGNGNIKTLSPPDLPDIEGLDFRPSGDTATIFQSGGKLTGSKEFEFSIIPEQEGIYEIPALQWSYFDPQDGTYKTHKSQKYTVSISPGASGPGDALTDLMNVPGDIKVRDILSVKTNASDLGPLSAPLITKPIFWILNAIPVLCLAGVIVIRRRQDRLMGDVRYRRLKRAVGMAKKRLSQADKFLSSGNSDAFYSEISRALYEYVGDKFNYSGAGLTESQVVEILRREKYPDNLIEEFSSLIKTADFGRFAPGQSGSDSAQGLHDKAVAWIVAAEQEGKRAR